MVLSLSYWVPGSKRIIQPIERILEKIVNYIYDALVKRLYIWILTIRILHVLRGRHGDIMIEVIFPGLKGYRDSQVFVEGLVRRLLKMGYTMSGSGDDNEDDYDDYPIESYSLVRDGEMIRVVWRFKVNAHVMIYCEKA
jgi:hypothetical protein